MNRRRALTSLGLAVLDPLPSAIALAAKAGTSLPKRDPRSVGLDADRIADADKVVATVVQNGGVPGAVLLMAHRGAVVLHNAYGQAALRPNAVAVRPDTLFDLASLTKVIATTTAIALLVESGMVGLDTTVETYLPAFASADGERQKVTVRHLLTHTAGLPAGGAYAGKTLTLTDITAIIARSRQLAAPGERFLYSDYSAITLQAVVEAVSGIPFDTFCRERIFLPLGMGDTMFRPSGDQATRCAATSEGDTDTRGFVHDPTARALGGVSGNAGLFSTADDLSRFCQMLLNRGSHDGKPLLKPETVRLFTTRQTGLAGGERSLGWDMDSPYSIRAGLPFGSFGHTGFTGTSVWIDPRTETFIILLTNAVHGRPARRDVIPLRRTVSNAVAAALPSGPAGRQRGRVGGRDLQTGLDVLSAEALHRLVGRNIGVVCNHTAVDRLGRHLVDRLVEYKQGKIVALFGPEHSIRGDVDASAADGKDARTGLPVYSLYNLSLPREQRYRPTSEQLTGIDTLLFDIQDIGTRYYTYIATLGYCLEEAAKRQIKVIVLDRPNPLGGELIEGPLLDAAFVGGFTTYHTMPVTHGMTIGELARLFNIEKGLKADLEVVPLTGWRRNMTFEQCELPWVNPSPNMRNIREALLYPGVGLLEVLPLSVGRGTDTPFEIIGAPYIDPMALSTELTARHLPGVTFSPTCFTPSASVYKGQLCGGVQIHLWERQGFLPTALGIHLADTLTRLYPQRFTPATLDSMKTMVGNAAIPAAIATGEKPERIIASWKRDVDSWKKRRAPFLLYSQP